MATKFTPKKKKITGTKKNDKITWVKKKGWKSALTVNAGNGNDVINFKESNYAKNKLNGGSGKDIIYGGKKADSIDGGLGDDKLYGYNGNDTIIGGKGSDIIYTGKGTNTVIINKGDGNDTIYHQGTKTTIKVNKALASDKQAFEKKGNDLIMTYTHGGTTTKEVITIKSYFTGNKNIYLGSQKLETLINSKGMTITGTNGNDTITGSAGNDIIKAGAGNDVITGGTGNDTIDGDDGADIIKGTAGNNVLSGGAGDDSIYAGSNNDTIDAGIGVNTIYIKSGSGNTTLKSGSGRDKIVFSDATSINDITSQYAANGSDLIISSGGKTVTVEGYKNGNHSVQRIAVGNGNVSKSITRITPKNPIIVDGDMPVFGTDNEDEITYDGDGTYIYAGKGDDIINSYGQDTISGQQGDDLINLYEEANKEIFIAPDDGNDEITGVENTSQTNLNFDNSASIWADKDEANGLLLKSISYKDGQYFEQETTISNYYNADGTVNAAVADKLKINGAALDVTALKNPVYMTENSHTSEETEFIYGTSGNDTITASDGNDTIYGNGGDDVIETSIGHDVIYLGSGNTTIKADMSMMVDGAPETYGYLENFKKTIYMQDDSVLTIDFAEDLFENGCGVFCRGSGLDNDLYISIDGGLSWCFRIKDYFDENKNPKTDSVNLKIWVYPEQFATQRVQQTYNVPEWACSSIWETTFDIQPFGPYEDALYGTNMPSEEIRTAYGNHDDTIYGGNGNIEAIYPYGGHNEIHSGEGTKLISMYGFQGNNEIYLGTEAATHTTIYMGGVQSNTSLIDGSGNLLLTWNVQDPEEGDNILTSTATVYNWTDKTSQATISMRGDNNDNTLTAVNGAANLLDGGSEGNDTLIGGTGVDTFKFSYNSHYGIDTVRNANSDDILRFESLATIDVDFSKFKYYKNNGGNNLVISTKGLSDVDSFTIIENYFTSTNKIDRVVGYNMSNDNEEQSLAVLIGNETDTFGCFEVANNNNYTGTNYADIMMGRTGTNILEAGKGNDFLYTYDGTNTFVFNAGDGDDILYQEGGENTILEFKDATIAELSSPMGYDRDVNGYYDDLLIHYDGENTLRVKDYYFASHNKVTLIKDSTGNLYNAADYFKYVIYVTGNVGEGTKNGDDIRVTTTSTSPIVVAGKKGSDIIWGGDSDEQIYTGNLNNRFTYDSTAGIVDTVHAGGGDDLIFATSETNIIYGDSGNDTIYILAGANNIISDSAGTEDFLAINSADGSDNGLYTNLHFVFNVNSEGVVDNSGLRILTNAEFDLWKTNTNHADLKGIQVVKAEDGTGSWDCIETFEDAGNDDGCSHMSVSALQTVKANVASWLSDKGYTDVADVFTNEKTEGDIAALIAKFDVTANWVYDAY